MILLSLEFIKRSLDHEGEHRIGLSLRDKLIERYAPFLRDAEFSARERGKPYIIYSNVTYSITHTDGCAACVLNLPNTSFEDITSLPETVTEDGVFRLNDDFDSPCEVGIDIERVDRDRGEARLSAIASRYFTEEETRLVERAKDKHKEFYRIWTGKESLVKCTGEGLSGVSFADTLKAAEMGFKLSHFFIRCGEDEYVGTVCRNDLLFPEEK